jgi:hypothetical protein
LTYKTSLTPSYLIEVPVPSQESKQSCIDVLGVSILPLSTIFILNSLIFLVFHLSNIALVENCSTLSVMQMCPLFPVAILIFLHKPISVPPFTYMSILFVNSLVYGVNIAHIENES